MRFEKVPKCQASVRKTPWTKDVETRTVKIYVLGMYLKSHRQVVLVISGYFEAIYC